jgi:hypothetical protein
VESAAEDIANEMATVVFEQVQSVMPEKRNLLPSEDAMEAMMVFDDPEMLEDMEDGFSKTIEFGGFVKAGWGCKVTYEKKDGKFSKQADCGFSGAGGEGPKPKLDDTDEKIVSDFFFKEE